MTATEQATNADPRDGQATTAEEWDRFASAIGAGPRPAPLRRWVQSPNAGHFSGLVWGTGKPDVVLVHDLGDSSNGWDAVSVRLQRTVVALDLPGHGRSSSASAIASPARQAPALIDAIRSIAPTAALVVASGFGAAVALQAAAKRPQSIRAVLVIDGSPTSSGVGPVIPGAPFANVVEATAALAAIAPRRSSALNRHLARETTVAASGGGLEWRYQLGEVPAELAGWLDVSQFRDVTTPIGVVTTGAEITDPIVRSILQRWPDARREVIHACPGDLVATSPTAVAAAIEAFLTWLTTPFPSDPGAS
ncbi:MAG: putative hydrolase [Ilumatobacteraceae bacterium]|nr:putative hydrolase [Ilumatobacteraceae bacterium]